MPFTIPTDNQQPAPSGHLAVHDNIADSLSIAVAINVQNTAYAGGAKGDGVTDDSAAFQAAINAAKTTSSSDGTNTTGTIQTVYVPSQLPNGNRAQYLINTPLTPQVGKSFRFVGDGATKLVTTSNGLINLNGAGHLVEADIYIAGFVMDVTGGHVIANPNIHGMFLWEKCSVVQRSTGFSVFYMDDQANSTSTALYTATFRDLDYWLGSGTRSVEAFHMISANGANITDVTFEHVNGPNPPGSTPAGYDNTQYQFYIDTTDGTGAITNVRWQACLAASFYGGYAKVNGVKNCTIDGCNFYNTYISVVNNDLITFGPSIGGNPSHYVTVRNISRNNGLGSQGGNPPPYDISFDSTTYNVLVENSCGQSPFCINLNGCSKAVIIGGGSNTFGQTYTIANQASDTVVINGAIQIAGANVINNDSAPGSVGLKVWNYDIVSYDRTNQSAAVAGTIYMLRFDVLSTITVTKLWWLNTTGGSGAVTGQNFIALVNSSGTILQSVGIDTQSVTSSMQQATITSTVLTPGMYYVALLINASGMPSVARSVGGVQDVATSAANYRFAVNGTSQTALPGSFTLSSNSNTGAFSFWVGLS